MQQSSSQAGAPPLQALRRAYPDTGMFESWPMSDEDAGWSRRFVDWTDDPVRLRRELFGLNRSFNPLRFQPEKWAELVAECGFRYCLITTKHHDGFCLWNTRYTDYKSTAPDCPYHDNPNADIVRAVFDAMRKRGVAIGAYFSKADWHCPDYWHDPSHTSRNPTYDPAREPERWERFVRFTQNQMLELARDYGPLDILWLDAGWVRAANGQDIRLGEVVEQIRRGDTPGLLVADRTVGGAFENYITPEQTVPQTPPGVPWESCVSLGSGFSYRYDDRYKQPRELVHLLLDIISKGGNLALNLAPQPDGRLPDPGVRSLRALGEWLRVNGEGVYGTRAQAPYRQDDLAFTHKDGVIYAFKMYHEGEGMPATVRLPLEGDIRSVRLLGYGKVPFNARGGCVIDMPRDMPVESPLIAHCFACEMG